MAWSMHPGQHYDEVQSHWYTPPPVEEGQTAFVHAPTATSLLIERTADSSDRTT
jgi:hypothetical protein